MKHALGKSGLLSDLFNKTIDGKQTRSYFLENNQGSLVAITNYGAKIISLIVPDKDDNFVDIVLGHNSIEEYLSSEEPYFGAICGRTANRICKGSFSLDGNTYQLAINNGPNSLHGGIKGFNSVVWDVEQQTDNTIVLSYLSIDGEEGYPGNLKVHVTYELTDDNSLNIYYKAQTDKTTIINLTNHSYFNLSGEGDYNIGDHILTLNADKYLPTDNTSIPYGKAESVKNTPMDFTSPHAIGDRINDNFEQLIFAKGYDHTFILNKEKENEYSFAGVCESPKTGIKMEIYTTEPGLQLYTGNWMTGGFIAKNGHNYPQRSAVCFETQHFPDSINNLEYPSIILKKNDTFESKTTYKFIK